jgi:hypothetical protein
MQLGGGEVTIPTNNTPPDTGILRRKGERGLKIRQNCVTCDFETTSKHHYRIKFEFEQ